MARKKAKSPVKNKPSRHVRRDCTGVNPPNDAVYQAFDACYSQAEFGRNMTQRQKAELFFRAGATAGAEIAAGKGEGR